MIAGLFFGLAFGMGGIGARGAGRSRRPDQHRVRLSALRLPAGDRLADDAAAEPGNRTAAQPQSGFRLRRRTGPLARQRGAFHGAVLNCLRTRHARRTIHHHHHHPVLRRNSATCPAVPSDGSRSADRCLARQSDREPARGAWRRGRFPWRRDRRLGRFRGADLWPLGDQAAARLAAWWNPAPPINTSSSDREMALGLCLA